MSAMLYPIGIQSFKEIRDGKYVYVDKTRHIYSLVHNGKYYFLGRPRRFGKSLLLSTIEAYFSGKKELFEGLAIEKLEEEWIEYPILHLDLNTGKYNQEDSLDLVLNKALTQWERIYGAMPEEKTLEFRFEGIIRRAAEKNHRNVVILIDEYDKPLLQAIGDESLQSEYRATLKAFYSVLKSQDKYVKFAFLTGVTKFGKVSVFSDLNNLNDISMDAAYVDICGITEEELLAYFSESINQLSIAGGMTLDETYAKLKELYDGYHFEAKTKGIYNPFSLLSTFQKKAFKDYWFKTGTPTFLVELLRNSDYDLCRLGAEEQEASQLDSIEGMFGNPIPVLYQTGYLTIKDYNPEFDTYTLGFPNKEVEKGFVKYLLPFYLNTKNGDGIFAVNRFVRDVRRGDVNAFMSRLQSLFAGADYKIIGDMEKYFQNSLYLIFKIMGFYTEVEQNTSHGSIDIVLKTDDFIYIIECKLDKSAAQAIEQIDSKGYCEPFAADTRQLYKIGVNFSSITRGIDEYMID